MTADRFLISWWKITGISLVCWWWESAFSAACWPGGLSAEGAGDTDWRKGFCMLLLASSVGKCAWGQGFLRSSLWQHIQFLQCPVHMCMAGRSSEWQAAFLVAMPGGSAAGGGGSGSCSVWQPTAHWPPSPASPTTTLPTAPILSTSVVESLVAPCRESLLQVQVSSNICFTAAAL